MSYTVDGYFEVNIKFVVNTLIIKQLSDRIVNNLHSTTKSKFIIFLVLI